MFILFWELTFTYQEGICQLDYKSRIKCIHILGTSLSIIMLQLYPAFITTCSDELSTKLEEEYSNKVCWERSCCTCALNARDYALITKPLIIVTWEGPDPPDNHPIINRHPILTQPRRNSTTRTGFRDDSILCQNFSIRKLINWLDGFWNPEFNVAFTRAF